MNVHENYNLSSKEAKREGISLENLVFFTVFQDFHENLFILAIFTKISKFP